MRTWIAVGLLVIVAGCGGKPYYYPFGKSAATEEIEAAPATEQGRTAVVTPETAGRESSFGTVTVAGAGGAKEDTLPPSPTERKVVYTATLQVSVPNRDAARKSVESLVQKHKGFIQRSSLEQVTFRLPPEEFDAALAEVEALGKVLGREVASEDVTAQYVDLGLRLDVAQKSRERLIGLLEHATKTEDMLQIEREIRRLTGEIEEIKGRQRALKDRIDLATITVTLTEIAPARPKPLPYRREGSPFAWIDQTGVDRALTPVSPKAWIKGEWSLRRLLGFREFRFPVPDGFVKLEHRKRLLIATTPQEDRLRVQLVSARQKTTLDFWAQALSGELDKARGYTVESPQTVGMGKRKDDLETRLLRCRAAFQGQTWLYDVWLVQETNDPGEFLVIEYVRPEGRPDSHFDAVKKSIQDAWIR